MFIAEQATGQVQLRRSDTSHAAPLGLVELIDGVTINMSLLTELSQYAVTGGRIICQAVRTMIQRSNASDQFSR